MFPVATSCSPFPRRTILAGLLVLLAVLPAWSLVQADPVGERPRIQGERMVMDVGALAHDSMAGRQTGTPGGEQARAFVIDAFESRNIPAIDGMRTFAFDFTPRGRDQQLEGMNIMGMVEGTVHPGRYLVVIAHYDHLGVRDGEIYNGADDNASGTAAILALADWFRENPPRHSIIFAALDAEEMGLQGARAFIADPPVPLDRVVMNVNLDMVSRSVVGELYAAGTYHYPFLEPLVEEAAENSSIQLLMGHDSPDLPPGDDWTMSSDHGPFHQAGIPFIYFGVEDHPGYHNPADVPEAITPAFYVEAIETTLDFILLADRRGEQILEERTASPAISSPAGR